MADPGRDAGRDERASVAQLLAENRIAPLDARVLLSHVTGMSRVALVTESTRRLDAGVVRRYRQLVARRIDGEPVAYLVGEREFYGRAFKVTPAVLVPRPETELLVEETLARGAAAAPLRVLDLGTGSGALAVTLALERPSWQVVAVDLSRAALAVAEENAQRLGATVAFVHSDWYQAVTGRFDLIVANPPYVAAGDPHLAAGDVRAEPTLALVGGADGCEALRAVVGSAPQHLLGGAWLLVEHGFEQGDAVRALFAAAGLTEVATRRDLAGLERVTWGRSVGSAG